MESKKQLFLIFGVAFCAFLVFVSIRIFSENDESRIRKTVYAGILAVEKKDIPRCAHLVSETYKDDYGNDKEHLLKIARDIFKAYEEFRIMIKRLKIEVKGSEGSANIGFTCYFKKPGDKNIYYDSGELKVYFHQENEAWKVSQLEYKGSNELLFLQSVA